MPSKELVREVLKNIQISTMSEKEKAMWTILLPLMPDGYLQKLNTTLEEEGKALMDIYFKNHE